MCIGCASVEWACRNGGCVRRLLLACGVAACLLGSSFAAPARAETVADRLAELKLALQVVRMTKAINPDRDAGPELTPVKVALRRWVEAQLPPPSKPGRIKGTIVTPDGDNLKALARLLTDRLDEAALTCGDVETEGYRCNAEDADDFFVSERGHVGPVQLGLVGDGAYLLVVTGVGVLCGEDESAYLYEPAGDRWKLVFASEQDNYRKGHYSVQNFTEIAVSPSAADGSSNPLPLVATLGYAPWCSSTWSSLFTRLWRMSATSISPMPLIDRADSMWFGDDDFGEARLDHNDLLVQYTAESMDSGVHNRKHLLHYRIGSADRIERVDPVALRPMDFVDEWLSSNWKDAVHWIEGAANPAGFKAAHGQGKAEFDDTGKRCREDRSLWQVALEGGRYFQVRWTAPYVFRMVAVSRRPFAGCDLADRDADNDQVSLFPDTQWHPSN